ncbi:hypothetical protein R1flu_023793 [Riccia fluitans]|uniref:Uncharacterized protein n=1 Tax=Riccia fluitans TaxID=41844 RepID=A0ABD1XW09_9MARC
MRRRSESHQIRLGGLFSAAGNNRYSVTHFLSLSIKRKYKMTVWLNCRKYQIALQSRKCCSVAPLEGGQWAERRLCQPLETPPVTTQECAII